MGEITRIKPEISKNNHIKAEPGKSGKIRGIPEKTIKNTPKNNLMKKGILYFNLSVLYNLYSIKKFNYKTQFYHNFNKLKVFLN